VFVLLPTRPLVVVRSTIVVAVMLAALEISGARFVTQIDLRLPARLSMSGCVGGPPVYRR
jgi:hypothetical protein